jgi:hypothetical protein
MDLFSVNTIKFINTKLFSGVNMILFDLIVNINLFRARYREERALGRSKRKDKK